ncbi:MAG: hypothetical protein EOM68_25570, partial [Spirochaetia bacterium]|nr:hypothetical protein [Spirochaetia bacterium]
MLNGKEILLKREYKENWVKPRGGTEERMDGHVSLFYIDGVKVQKQDYDKQVNDICDEQTFKILSNPSVFPSMHWEEQRKILFTLAGSMEPYEICKDHKDIIGLLDRMGKLKSKEYKERLAAQKTEVNKAIADTTPRIEELSNTAHPKEDWDDLQRQVAELDSLILKQEEERASVAKQNEAANLQKSQIMEQVYTERDRLSQLKAQHKEAFYADYTRQVQEYNSLLVEYTTKEQKRTLVASIISKMKAEAATVVADLERLRGEYTTIAEQEFSGLPEGADTCHTCGQALPTATVEDLNTQALTIFNTSKESKLKSIVEKGAALKEKLAQLEKGYAELHSQLPQTPVAPAKPVAPEYTEVETEEMKAVRDRIASLEAQRDAVVSTPVDNTALLELRKQRDALMSRLYVKDAIASNNARIKELKEHLKANAQRKAEIEQEEDLLAQYNRIMVDHMESKVSGMFSFVRFKLFKKLINEGEVATCELLNDGVPY